MRMKTVILAIMLAVSGSVVWIAGMVVKFAILSPRGIYQDKAAVALPFLLLEDEGLQYLLSETIPEPQLPEPTNPFPSETEPLPTESLPADFVAAKPEILDRVLFIGDSRTCALRDHARIDGADYFCDVGMSVFNIDRKNLTDESFDAMTLEELLSSREYTCVTVNLGLNEAGYPLASLKAAYRSLLTDILRTQPQATVVLQGILTVGKNWPASASYASPQNLASISLCIRGLAEEYRCFYIDANDTFADSDGYLPDALTWDGCHLYAAQTELWSRWFCDTVEKLKR